MMVWVDGVGVGAQYEDLNGLFEALHMVTGVDVDEYIRQSPTDADELYVQVANAIGLQSTLELSAASSTQFMPQEAGVEREVHMYLGGLQAIEQRIEARTIQTEAQRQALQARAHAYAERYNSIPPFLGHQLHF